MASPRATRKEPTKVTITRMGTEPDASKADERLQAYRVKRGTEHFASYWEGISEDESMELARLFGHFMLDVVNKKRVNNDAFVAALAQKLIAGRFLNAEVVSSATGLRWVKEKFDRAKESGKALERIVYPCAVTVSLNYLFHFYMKVQGTKEDLTGLRSIKSLRVLPDLIDAFETRSDQGKLYWIDDPEDVLQYCASATSETPEDVKVQQHTQPAAVPDDKLEAILARDTNQATFSRAEIEDIIGSADGSQHRSTKKQTIETENKVTRADVEEKLASFIEAVSNPLSQVSTIQNLFSNFDSRLLFVLNPSLKKLIAVQIKSFALRVAQDLVKSEDKDELIFKSSQAAKTNALDKKLAVAVDVIECIRDEANLGQLSKTSIKMLATLQSIIADLRTHFDEKEEDENAAEDMKQRQSDGQSQSPIKTEAKSLKRKLDVFM